MAEHAGRHQGVRGVEQPLDFAQAVALLALLDEVAAVVEVVEDPFRVGPLPKQMVGLEEVVVAEGRVRHHQRLQRHGVLFEAIADAGVGVDDDLVGEAAHSLAVELLVMDEVLAEGPVPVDHRHPDRRVGVEHLLGRDDLDLVGIDVEAEILFGNLRDRVVRASEAVEGPVGAVEEQFPPGFSHCRAPPPCGRRARGTPDRYRRRAPPASWRNSATSAPRSDRRSRARCRCRRS